MDGIFWQQATAPPLVDQVRAVAYGNGTFVATGERSLWLTSSNGRFYRAVFP